MNLDTKIAKLYNPFIIDNELPQALPAKSTGPSFPDLPEITHSAVANVEEYNSLFPQQIRWTNITYHFTDIDNEPPVKANPTLSFSIMLTKSRSISQSW